MLEDGEDMNEEQMLKAAMREAISLLEKSAKESRAADRMIYAHRAKVALKKALGEAEPDNA